MTLLILFFGIIIYVIYDFLKRVNKTEEKDLIPEKEEEPQIMVKPLKPKLTEPYLTLDNYIGQEKSIIYLKGHIKKAQELNEPLPHIALYGPGGLGKSTLIKAVAHYMGGNFYELVPANLRSIKDLHGSFLNKQCSCGYLSPFSSKRCLRCKNDIFLYYTPIVMFKTGDFVFLEECHQLKEEIEEAIYSLMQDGYMVIRYNGVDQIVEFPPITIAGATTRFGDLKKPFRDRFKISIHMEYYTLEEMKKIIKKYAEHCNLEIADDKTLEKISYISHGIPRIGKKYIKDLSTLSSVIDENSLGTICALLNIDDHGLSQWHRNALEYIFERMCSSKNGGAGAASIASSIGLKTEEYTDIYEPALIYKKLIFMASRGRRLTDKAINIYFPDRKEKIK